MNTAPFSDASKNLISVLAYPMIMCIYIYISYKDVCMYVCNVM